MSDPSELAAIRSSVSLAAQVIHQSRVLAVLRDNPEQAPRLLLDPIALQQAVDARYGKHGLKAEPADTLDAHYP